MNEVYVVGPRNGKPICYFNSLEEAEKFAASNSRSYKVSVVRFGNCMMEYCGYVKVEDIYHPHYEMHIRYANSKVHSRATLVCTHSISGKTLNVSFQVIRAASEKDARLVAVNTVKSIIDEETMPSWLLDGMGPANA